MPAGGEDIAAARVADRYLNFGGTHGGEEILDLFGRGGVECRVISVVEDDGVGFDTEILKQSKRVGLKAVKNRLEYQLGATIDVVSEPGKGTKITINIPTLPRVSAK